MGTSTTLAQAAGKVDQVNQAFDGRALAAITKRVGMKAKPIATRAIEPNSLSHWGRGGRKGGYKVEARFEALSGTEVALRPTVAPLAALLEKGSGTTWKSPKRRGSARRKKGTVGSYQRARVPARNAWSKAKPPVERMAPKIVDEEVQRVLRGIF